ncbi:MAG: hypothetical protein CTY33_05120 [Methylotenera sp.]|nr:MAG: hypothetical protein CTY33_05120 [Methylotenera sp.]
MDRVVLTHLSISYEGAIMDAPHNITADGFQRLFESSPASFLILLPNDDFTIVAVTDDYLSDTLTKREDILGKPLFEVFPDNPTVPESHSTKVLAESFRRAMASKSVDTMDIIRYDVPHPDGMGFEERYWQPVNKVAISHNGDILYIMHRAQDVTDYVKLLAENKENAREREDLAAQNKNMEKEVEHRNKELEEKNMELLQANDALKQYSEKMREQGQKKDEFLAMLAHELRNPLAPISASAELLDLGLLNEARIKKTSGIIKRQVNHLIGLVDDLLDVSRVTRGLISLEKTSFDAKKILNDAVEQVRPLIEARHHLLTVHYPNESVNITGDLKRLVQVVTNLLTNAAKYTAEGGEIFLNLDVEGGRIKIEVTDNGVGMEPHLQAIAFELFVQAARTSDRSQGGLGIGLALAKSIVELHNGSIAVNSEGVGMGSRFTVLLPTSSEKLVSTSSVGEVHGKSAISNSLKVMVVDDNVDGAQVLSMLIEAFGHQCLTEYHPYKALERSRVESHDVYLLDIGLPDIDGYELARRLRAQPETANAILVAITGYGQDQDRKSALEAGFNYHFVKPIDNAKLSSFLAEIDNQ